MTGDRITLTADELVLGAEIGKGRRLRALERRAADQFPTPPDLAWARDVRGALAELAFAKLLGVYFMPGSRLDRASGDVAGYQVRSTCDVENGELILRPPDAETRIYVLMVGADREWRRAGWMSGKEGKDRSRFWSVVPFPAFHVPQQALHPWPPPAAPQRRTPEEDFLDLT